MTSSPTTLTLTGAIKQTATMTGPPSTTVVAFVSGTNTVLAHAETRDSGTFELHFTDAAYFAATGGRLLPVALRIQEGKAQPISTENVLEWFYGSDLHHAVRIEPWLVVLRHTQPATTPLPGDAVHGLVSGSVRSGTIPSVGSVVQLVDLDFGEERILGQRLTQTGGQAMTVDTSINRPQPRLAQHPRVNPSLHASVPR